MSRNISSRLSSVGKVVIVVVVVVVVVALGLDTSCLGTKYGLRVNKLHSNLAQCHLKY